MAVRGEFSSKIGFVLAAAGSAIGLGNIWGFPIQVAENGGGAFVFTYIVLTFLLAYPILMAELIIGRYSKKDTVSSILAVSNTSTRPIAYLTGYWGIVTASLILSFYAIVAGWVVAYFISNIAQLLGWSEAVEWLKTDSLLRNIIFCSLFYILTIKIVASGVTSGIEKWSTRLMPILIALMILLISYIATLPGAMQGWKIYLQPDFSQVMNPSLVIDALGQAFFSLSLGVGTMMVYGSYISKSENLPKLGAIVAVLDIAIAFLAGLLVIPAMYVALNNGVEIFDQAGNLVKSGGLIFAVLPSLFETIGFVGYLLGILFFALLSIAALTSSISMLEVPVAYVSETHNQGRQKAAYLVGSLVYIISVVIIFNFALLFDRVVTFTTVYSEPLIGLLFCLFVGWVWKRNKILQEIKSGYPDAEKSLFWKIWPRYVQFVCPFMMIVIFWHTFS